VTQAAPERRGYEWPPLPVTDPEIAAQILAERLQAAWDDLEAERLRVLLSLTMGRKQLVDATLREYLAAIDAFLADVDGNVQRFLELHLGPRYQEGAEVAVPGQFSWTSAHLAALTSLATDTYDDLLQRAREAERVSQAFVTAIRDAAATELPKIAAGGRTAVQVADRLEERLLTQYGITHVTYRDGSHVTVRHYVRMAARTKSAVAYNAGTLNAIYAAGGEWVEVFDGADCGWTSHLDLDKANGTIRHVNEAATYMIAHPQCTRGFGARFDVKTKADAKHAQPSTTAEQRADQKAVAAERAAAPRPAVVRRARLTAQRQARQLGARDPEQVGSIIARILKERGLT
jgi:hypothetical protein